MLWGGEYMIRILTQQSAQSTRPTCADDEKSFGFQREAQPGLPQLFFITYFRVTAVGAVNGERHAIPQCDYVAVDGHPVQDARNH